jgi:hypothetical protein
MTDRGSEGSPRADGTALPRPVATSRWVIRSTGMIPGPGMPIPAGIRRGSRHLPAIRPTVADLPKNFLQTCFLG